VTETADAGGHDSLAAAADDDIDQAGIDVVVTRLDASVPLPSYAHPLDAGADLVTTVDVTLAPGQRALVPTGLAIALPAGHAGFVHPRSGLAARHGLSIVNAPGTIDAGYRGEIKVCLINLDPAATVHLRRGDRVAQLVVQRVEAIRFVETDRLPTSVRGAAGYGSTGGFSDHPPTKSQDALQDSGQQRRREDA